MALERSTITPELKPNSPIMIVLDIDDTLASPVSKYNLIKDYMSWFRDNDLIVDAIEKHILHPGVIEFIRYLYEAPNISFCFFSHGIAERNNLIVPLILKRALCDKAYKHALNEEQFKLFEDNMKKNNIFSREDCPNHKDLRTVTVKLGSDLNSTILIDDQRCSLTNNQKQNGLIIEYADDLLFDHTSTKLLDDEHTEKWCSQTELRSVNHIFYATALLERLFSLQPKPITQSLLELQYKENGIEDFWLEKYDIVLITLKNRESLDVSMIKNLSCQHGNVPVLIHVFDPKELIIYGKPNAVDWAFTSLDHAFVKKFNFPWVFNEGVLLAKLYYDSSRRDLMDLRDEIQNKNGHTVIKYEPRFELYNDSSLYMRGLKILREFATSPLEFYGHNASQFFGLENNEAKASHDDLTNSSGYGRFWSVSVRSNGRNESNEVIKSNPVANFR